MEGFRNRLPHVGFQVHVQDSIGGEVAVYLADDGLLEGDKSEESYSVLFFTTCFLLARDHCATWCTLAEFFCSMYT